VKKVFATFLEELEARTAIEDCLKRFARAVDRQDWKAAREAYHDGAFDDHGFFKGPPDAFLAHIAKLHEQQHHSMHFNTNVLIEFQSRERAFVETYVLVLQRFADRRVTASARAAAWIFSQSCIVRTGLVFIVSAGRGDRPCRASAR